MHDASRPCPFLVCHANLSETTVLHTQNLPIAVVFYHASSCSPFTRYGSWFLLSSMAHDRQNPCSLLFPSAPVYSSLPETSAGKILLKSPEVSFLSHHHRNFPFLSYATAVMSNTFHWRIHPSFHLYL
ncbi:hypothetical protein FVEG_16801 [Fusarium verticillioides 7600]|uniref:Uncharacterized protein n=1 Tax=Gibberella moniliformis (strain M3125 / FGSC 7600) TaxID=334819 RepID=W7MJE7_GIBM7|nr:hypothetical protein FVEG_16801 [Fusarium verticillioides 7600]EWG51478.1 hypothetical protein FVEG_16801 [Fusarium verticillioides 7600]